MDGPRADVQTTMRCLHDAPHADDARLVAEAFALPARDELEERLER